MIGVGLFEDCIWLQRAVAVQRAPHVLFMLALFNKEIRDSNWSFSRYLLHYVKQHFSERETS